MVCGNVQGASVVLLEDLPGLDMGVDLLDDVPDSVDAAADLLGDVGELFQAGSLGRGRQSRWVRVSEPL